MVQMDVVVEEDGEEEEEEEEVMCINFEGIVLPPQHFNNVMLFPL